MPTPPAQSHSKIISQPPEMDIRAGRCSNQSGTTLWNCVVVVVVVVVVVGIVCFYVIIPNSYDDGRMFTSKRWIFQNARIQADCMYLMMTLHGWSRFLFGGSATFTDNCFMLAVTLAICNSLVGPLAGTTHCTRKIVAKKPHAWTFCSTLIYLCVQKDMCACVRRVVGVHG